MIKTPETLPRVIADELVKASTKEVEKVRTACSLYEAKCWDEVAAAKAAIKKAEHELDVSRGYLDAAVEASTIAQTILNTRFLDFRKALSESKAKE